MPGPRSVMTADPSHQPDSKGDRAEPDQDACRSQEDPDGWIEVRVLLQRQQREIKTGVQRDRGKQHQKSARDACPVAVMAVRPERSAGARDRQISPCDDAERAVERHGQDAAQGCQRLPHLGMLHQISEVFVGRKA